MKKHDEGYVLAYVTVVLLIFCLVAALILTGAHRNLKHQQDSIHQMKDQYVAEGMIEQVLAQWSSLTILDDGSILIRGTDTGVKRTGAGDWEDPKNQQTVKDTVTLYAEYGIVTVTCVLKADNSQVLSYEIGTAESEATLSEMGGDGE